MKKLKLVLSLVAIFFVASSFTSATANKAIVSQHKVLNDPYLGTFDYEFPDHLIISIDLFGVTDMFGIATVTSAENAINHHPYTASGSVDTNSFPYYATSIDVNGGDITYNGYLY